MKPDEPGDGLKLNNNESEKLFNKQVIFRLVKGGSYNSTSGVRKELGYARSAARTHSKKDPVQEGCDCLSKTKRPGKRASGKKDAGKRPEKLYTLSVYIVGGPLPKRFDDKVISRTIQIRGSQTLEELHGAIYKAFDKWDEHLYEFLLGDGPRDRSMVYSFAGPGTWGGGDSKGDVTRTTIGSLGLKAGRVFCYRFDLGDDWLHRVDVDAVEDFSGTGKYPKVIGRKSESPPQYCDEEE